MDLWTSVLQKIGQKLSKPSFETWFADTKLKSLTASLQSTPKMTLRLTG
ncbi:DnaA N-terminal domain-containing protein [Neobacillus niacini]|nr:DnaA N-terminal domain-containing protein [Neobacillus niacini]MCM3768310.1 hypothetical protein [Neobacillus niacini]